MNNRSRTALAVAATAGVAVIALLAVLRADSRLSPATAARRAAASGRRLEVERWDYEGGNIPEVSIGSGEQGRIVAGDERDG